MASGALAGVYAKLDRAGAHLEALKGEISPYVPDAYEVRQELDLEAGRYSLRVGVLRRLPLRWSIIVGDIAHNLRSALDHLAWQLVIASEHEPDSGTAFPIFIKEPVSGKPKAAWGRMTSRMAPKILETVREVQPYTTGDRADKCGLAILAALSNEDKHRLPVVCVSAIGPVPFGSFGFVPVKDVEVGPAIVRTGEPLEDDQEFAYADIAVTGPEPKIEVEGEIPLHVAFGDALATTDGLADICDQTRNVVRLFERYGDFR